jgi:hypothetical protein
MSQKWHFEGGKGTKSLSCLESFRERWARVPQIDQMTACCNSTVTSLPLVVWVLVCVLGTNIY